MGKTKKKHSEKIYRVQKYLNYFIRIALVLAIFSSILGKSWTVLFISLLTFILTFLPYIFEEKYKIDIPVEFEILIVLFIYATLFLGEVLGFYGRFWWWDIALHSVSALGFGVIGFLILFILYKGGKVGTNYFWIAVFSFSFAMAIGAVWEIFEFTMDSIFGLEMQKPGIADTMWDLIVDGIGAFIASISGYFYLKGEGQSSFVNMMGRFTRENPGLFE